MTTLVGESRMTIRVVVSAANEAWFLRIQRVRAPLDLARRLAMESSVLHSARGKCQRERSCCGDTATCGAYDRGDGDSRSVCREGSIQKHLVLIVVNHHQLYGLTNYAAPGDIDRSAC